MRDELEGNTHNVMTFYWTAYLGNPAKAVPLYVGAEYIQHNPLVGNGKQAFIDYSMEMAEQCPCKKIEFPCAVAIETSSLYTTIRRGQTMKHTDDGFLSIRLGRKDPLALGCHSRISN